jgi:hypothetical protein
MGFLAAIRLLAILGFGFPHSQADHAPSEGMPQGVVNALAADEKKYCDQFLEDFKKDCGRKFRANLSWRELLITPLGKTAILVESKNMGFCGSAGCSLYLFVQQSNGKFVQILGPHGEVGALANVKTLKTVTKGHFDLQKTWHDAKTRTTYQWNGSWYSPD